MRKCLQCGDLMVGRSDKKFCSDHCRAFHHNLKKQKENKVIRQVNRKLRRNYNILAKLYPNSGNRISKSRLVEEGFDFKYCTKSYKAQSGRIYKFCYEHGFLELENGILHLIKAKDL